MRTFRLFSILLILSEFISPRPIRAGTAAPPTLADAIKTFGTAGKELRIFGGGKEAELFHRDGSGCLTHMWFGGDWPGYERTRIRVFVDGEAAPSIDMELGLGHGIGFGDTAAPWGIARMGKTGNQSGVCFSAYRFHDDDPVFFQKGLRLTCRCGEKAGDKVFGGDPGDPKPTTFTTYTWIYEW